MPLGDSPLGDVPLGDSATIAQLPDVPTLPRAALFDPQTRDYPLDENGRYQDVHPVDAEVVYALTLEFGKVSAAASTGQTFRAIPSPIGPKVSRDVEDRVRRALRRLTDRQAITVLSIRNRAPNRHTLFIEVNYRNNELDQTADPRSLLLQ